jgi:glycerol kinase
VDRRFEPAIDEDARAERLTRWQRAVQRAREWA